MNKTSASEIRARARDTMLNNPYVPVIVTFVFFLISLVLNSCTAFFTLGEELWMIWSAKIAGLIFAVFTGLFSLGRIRYFTVLCENKSEATVGMLFCAFRSYPDRILSASLFLEGIDFVFTLPGFIYSLYYPVSFTQPKHLLIAFGILSAGHLIAFLITAAFMPLYYIMGDFTKISFPKALKMSSWLMKGNYFRYLGLCISLIPLILLGFVSFGIAFLWISPVIQSANAHFYLDLVNQKQQT